MNLHEPYRNPRPYCYSIFYGGVRQGLVWASSADDAAHLASLEWGYCLPSNRTLYRIPEQDWKP